MLPILVTLSLIILPKSCEEKEPEDEQLCIAVHTINDNICDANALDNPRDKTQLKQLYQIQNGKPKLIAYASKRLPESAKNYSITELEQCGLAINIACFPTC